MQQDHIAGVILTTPRTLNDSIATAHGSTTRIPSTPPPVLIEDRFDEKYARKQLLGARAANELTTKLHAYSECPISILALVHPPILRSHDS